MNNLFKLNNNYYFGTERTLMRFYLLLQLLIFNSLSNALVAIEYNVRAFKPIDIQQVARAQKKIAREMELKIQAQRAVIISLLATSGYLFYQWALPETKITLSVQQPEVVLPKEPVEVVLNQLDVKITSIAREVHDVVSRDLVSREFLRDQGYVVGGKLEWGQWAKGWGYWVARTFGNAFMFGIAGSTISPLMKYFKQLESFADRNVSKLFHEVSLKWFLTTRVHLPATFTDLETLAKQLDEEIVPKQNDLSEHLVKEHEFHKLCLSQSWSIFITQMERILGFIEYRRTTFVPLVHERSNQIAQHIFQIVFKSANDLRLHSADDQTSGNYTDILNNMRKALDQELKTFIDLEVIDFA